MESSISYILNHSFLGIELKTWLAIFSIFISLIALLFNLFDIKIKINNFFKIKKLNKISQTLTAKVLSSIYLYNKKISIDTFFSPEKTYEHKIKNVNYSKELNIIIEEYKNIYLSSFFKNQKLNYTIDILERLYGIIENDDKIIKQCTFHGSYGHPQSSKIKNIEKISIEYLNLYKIEINHPREVLNLI